MAPELSKYLMIKADGWMPPQAVRKNYVVVGPTPSFMPLGWSTRALRVCLHRPHRHCWLKDCNLACMCAQIGRTLYTCIYTWTSTWRTESFSTEAEELFFCREFHEDSKWLQSPINGTKPPTRNKTWTSFYSIDLWTPKASCKRESLIMIEHYLIVVIEFTRLIIMGDSNISAYHNIKPPIWSIHFWFHTGNVQYHTGGHTPDCM